MAGASLLALLDDIASILDDVAGMTKVAAEKTAGVLGDDLALNAQQVSGVSPERELPVVWSVAKGSAVNKLILVPAALALSAFAPKAVIPLLMLGGIFLCFEGCEKLLHRFLEKRHQKSVQESAPPADTAPQLGAHTATSTEVPPMTAKKPLTEAEKIRGAVRTDFILSAEIVVITLGTVVGATLLRQVLVVSGIAVLMTVGVYGLVAAIVKLDDFGLRLTARSGRGPFSALSRVTGRGILRMAPVLMKLLSIGGTIAMFLVGGGIISHSTPPVHHLADRLQSVISGLTGMDPRMSHALAVVSGLAFDAAVGIAAGLIAVALVHLIRAVISKVRTRPVSG
ncbi:MAG: DUF808 domain-containing protein [Planctomyces sp.]|jgi:predicted DNA repair protein MutK